MDFIPNNHPVNATDCAANHEWPRKGEEVCEKPWTYIQKAIFQVAGTGDDRTTNLWITRYRGFLPNATFGPGEKSH